MDVLVLSKAKLDDSHHKLDEPHPSSEFQIAGYRPPFLLDIN